MKTLCSPEVKAAVGTKDTAAMFSTIKAVWQEVQQYGLDKLQLLKITDVSAEERPQDYS